ncbi:MAG: 50S ribosomal protein L11 methyltransferase [Desulfopila sp.]
MNSNHVKKWLKMTIVVDPVLVDAAVDFFIGVIDAGVEVGVDEDIILKILNVYVEKENPADDELDWITAQVESHLHQLAEIFQVDPPTLEWEIFEEEDWGTNWKKHFAPFAVSPRLVIVPTWEEYCAGEGERVIIMDPGMAFGTGHHATTALVVQLLEKEIVQAGGVPSVLDVGCGTGILGMAAAVFGAARVYAMDNDPVAVMAAQKNCRRNALAGIMEVEDTPLEELDEQYSLVLANIIHDVLVDMAADLRRVTTIGGKLILSGILQGKQDASIISAFEEIGCRLEDKIDRDEWTALLFRRVD